MLLCKIHQRTKLKGETHADAHRTHLCLTVNAWLKLCLDYIFILLMCYCVSFTNI